MRRADNPDANRARSLCVEHSHVVEEPTSSDFCDGLRVERELGFARLACDLAGEPYALHAVPRWVLKCMGLFMPVLRENKEMMYQFEHDYRFDSSKIASAYGLHATPYRQGIRESLAVGTHTRA